MAFGGRYPGAYSMTKSFVLLICSIFFIQMSSLTRLEALWALQFLVQAVSPLLQALMVMAGLLQEQKLE